MKRSKVSGVKKKFVDLFCETPAAIPYNLQLASRAGETNVNHVFQILTKPREYPLLNLRNKVLSCIKIFI